MKQTFNHFIQEQFNDETIDDQIYEQRRIIAKAEQEIKRLNAIREEQESKPWHQWDSVKFTHIGYSHSDGYRSHRTCKDTFKTYEEFVRVILKNIDPDNRFGGEDDSDFIIISPNGHDYDLEADEIRNLPLVKEFFERKELRKLLKKEERELYSIEDDINHLKKEIEATDKYTEAYIQSLREKQSLVISERDELRTKIENSETSKRLKDLDELLSEIDKKER